MGMNVRTRTQGTSGFEFPEEGAPPRAQTNLMFGQCWAGAQRIHTCHFPHGFCSSDGEFTLKQTLSCLKPHFIPASSVFILQATGCVCYDICVRDAPLWSLGQCDAQLLRKGCAVWPWTLDNLTLLIQTEDKGMLWTRWVWLHTVDPGYGAVPVGYSCRAEGFPPGSPGLPSSPLT